MFSKISIIFLTLFISGILGDKAQFTTDVTASTAKLLGVNCMVESVLKLEDEADEFSYQINNICGKTAANNLYSELDDTQELLRRTAKVISVNEKVCNNDGYDADKDAEVVPSTECVNGMQRHMGNLYTSLSKTKKDIVAGLAEEYSSGACVKMAMTSFKLVLGNFSTLISTCASLTK